MRSLSWRKKGVFRTERCTRGLYRTVVLADALRGYVRHGLVRVAGRVELQPGRAAALGCAEGGEEELVNRFPCRAAEADRFELRSLGAARRRCELAVADAACTG